MLLNIYLRWRQKILMNLMNPQYQMNLRYLMIQMYRQYH
jgi:hypothetical protein